MALISASFGVAFTPTKTTFAIQCTGGSAVLYRRQDASAPWAYAGMLAEGTAYNVDNSAVGSSYKVESATGSAAFRADE